MQLTENVRSSSLITILLANLQFMKHDNSGRYVGILQANPGSLLARTSSPFALVSTKSSNECAEKDCDVSVNILKNIKLICSNRLVIGQLYINSLRNKLHALHSNVNLTSF